MSFNLSEFVLPALIHSAMVNRIFFIKIIARTNFISDQVLLELFNLTNTSV